MVAGAPLCGKRGRSPGACPIGGCAPSIASCLVQARSPDVHLTAMPLGALRRDPRSGARTGLDSMPIRCPCGHHRISQTRVLGPVEPTPPAQRGPIAPTAAASCDAQRASIRLEMGAPRAWIDDSREDAPTGITGGSVAQESSTERDADAALHRRIEGEICARDLRRRAGRAAAAGAHANRVRTGRRQRDREREAHPTGALPRAV